VRKQLEKRRGATVVEAAVVYPVVFLLTLGFIICVMGVFRYQEVATLAREACRYAAVHGTDYAKETGNTAPTPADLYDQVIKPKSIALDPSQVTYSITYDKSNNPVHAIIVNGDVTYKYNTVTVVVTYRWIPELYLGGVTLQSSCSMQMSY
jgi:Flp pilus assembly protein TadG